ncbi:cysteine desulfurase [Candidatus Gottesmanbacteria bacterium RBG_13_45_10]|uniref:Cysteine desulfurase n=1 Tax=Candidatus Gottesmanbacteria bacterium RBG_13_45_10 TaxID=1798370 RepID=A0A1F5ZGN0_9BACT|nr:MAG: cysteine desulfurase [Candidatus Gottesmanbacteria bacterium RBG_13_45_10]
MIDTRKVRNDFPILQKLIDGKPLVYLDSTATSLKPQSVIDAMDEYYTEYSANVFRGIYKISERATEAYESARERIGRFIGAHDSSEVIYTRGTDESISLVYYSWVLPHCKPQDEIVTTIMEHHANFVPWQQAKLHHGVTLKIWYTTPEGQLDLNNLDKIITRRTKLLAITAVSNVLGTINPIEEIVKRVKKLNPQCLVLVDAAQAAPHMPISVQTWGVDFVAFSSHKMLGPTGIGVLWGKNELLETIEPFNFGGDMIKEVHETATIFNDVPHKFEAGTPHIAGAIGLGAAVDYLSKLGMDEVREHEKEITAYALKTLSSIPGLTIVGSQNAENRSGVIAFTVKGIHPHDVAQVLDEDNVCIRVGFHCAQPLHEYLKIGATARASFYLYTTKEDIHALAKGLEKAQKIFA